MPQLLKPQLFLQTGGGPTKYCYWRICFYTAEQCTSSDELYLTKNIYNKD